ncbi:MAG: DUF1704 domain-containing protein [Candidatus Theseobacter exili]|nr:DUF1704 domain-containing protein [Candidatus Theseobacter exili]
MNNVFEQIIIFENYVRQMLGKIDFSSVLLPVNRPEERKLFLDNISSGKIYNPQYIYQTSPELDSFRKSLSEFTFDDSALGKLYSKQLKRLLIELDFLEFRHDRNFSVFSEKLHGVCDKEVIKDARKILLNTSMADFNEPVSAHEVFESLKNELERLSLPWKIVLESNVASKVRIDPRHKKVIVNRDLNYMSSEIERLKVHEIQVHVLRGENGSRQPFKMFQTGFAGYNETEEGLAVYAEDICSCLDCAQEKVYAGRALAVELSLKLSFYETYMELNKYFPEQLAYRLVERTKRGLVDTSGPGALIKDVHYLSGRKKIKEFVQNGNNINLLYVGKVSLNDIILIEKMLDEGIIEDPYHIPDFLTLEK